LEGDQFPNEETVPLRLNTHYILDGLQNDSAPFCAVSSTVCSTLPLPYLLHGQSTDTNSAVGSTWQCTRLVVFLVTISSWQRRPSGLYCASRRPKSTVSNPRDKEGFIIHTKLSQNMLLVLKQETLRHFYSPLCLQTTTPLLSYSHLSHTHISLILTSLSYSHLSHTHISLILTSLSYSHLSHTRISLILTSLSYSHPSQSRSYV
jgi:hypothetical protein